MGVAIDKRRVCPRKQIDNGCGSTEASVKHNWRKVVCFHCSVSSCEVRGELACSERLYVCLMAQ